jgi:hypothetical protein
MTVIDYRARLVAIDEFWEAHADLIDYVEVRDATDIMSTHGLSQAEVQAMFLRGEHIAMDCSEAFTTSCRWAGLPDPNGPEFNYNGYGNTTTIAAFLAAIQIASTLDGDAIMFMPPPEGLAHVTQKVGGSGGDPLVFSNGSEAGPYIFPLSDEAPAHPGQAVIGFSIAKLIPSVPPPPDYHYTRYDQVAIQLPNGHNSEMQVVKNYDEQRLHPVANYESLRKIKVNLGFFAQRIRNDEESSRDPDGKEFNRAWRLPQLEARHAGKQIAK